MDALKRAKELMEADHADLAIIQFYKAIMARLKMATMKRGYFDSNRVLVNAKKSGIITTENQELLNVVVFQNAIASSTTPVEPGAADKVSEATKKFLSTVAV